MTATVKTSQVLYDNPLYIPGAAGCLWLDAPDRRVQQLHQPGDIRAALLARLQGIGQEKEGKVRYGLVVFLVLVLLWF